MLFLNVLHEVSYVWERGKLITSWRYVSNVKTPAEIIKHTDMKFSLEFCHALYCNHFMFGATRVWWDYKAEKEKVIFKYYVRFFHGGEADDYRMNVLRAFYVEDCCFIKMNSDFVWIFQYGFFISTRVRKY